MEPNNTPAPQDNPQPPSHPQVPFQSAPPPTQNNPQQPLNNTVASPIEQKVKKENLGRINRKTFLIVTLFMFAPLIIAIFVNPMFAFFLIILILGYWYIAIPIFIYLLLVEARAGAQRYLDAGMGYGMAVLLTFCLIFIPYVNIVALILAVVLPSKNQTTKYGSIPTGVQIRRIFPFIKQH